jgi:hypothetical protein
MGVLSVGQGTGFPGPINRGVTWTFPQSGISRVWGNLTAHRGVELPRLV